MLFVNKQIVSTKGLENQFTDKVRLYHRYSNIPISMDDYTLSVKYSLKLKIKQLQLEKNYDFFSK